MLNVEGSPEIEGMLEKTELVKKMRFDCLEPGHAYVAAEEIKITVKDEMDEKGRAEKAAFFIPYGTEFLIPARGSGYHSKRVVFGNGIEFFVGDESYPEEEVSVFEKDRTSIRAR